MRSRVCECVCGGDVKLGGGDIHQHFIHTSFIESLLGIFWNNPALGSSRLQVHLLTGGRVGGMYTGKNPSGRSGRKVLTSWSRPERRLLKKGGKGGRKKKKLFHVISEEIFKFVRPQGFMKRKNGGKGALDSHSTPA